MAAPARPPFVSHGGIIGNFYVADSTGNKGVFGPGEKGGRAGANRNFFLPDENFFIKK